MLKYKIRGISFTCDEVSGKCHIIGAGEEIEMDNPIEAFNSFWGRAGAALLDEIRNAIEKNGFNRYLGVKNGKEDVS